MAVFQVAASDFQDLRKALPHSVGVERQGIGCRYCLAVAFQIALKGSGQLLAVLLVIANELGNSSIAKIGIGNNSVQDLKGMI